MATFKFDEADKFIQEESGKISFLKLQDDGWYAKVRFMYGPGETFEGQSVHNVSDDPRRPHYVPCLRQLGQPLDSCPLCVNGYKVSGQFFIPVFVHSIVSNVRGVAQEELVNKVMLFQRGTTFQGTIKSVIRQTMSSGKPIVSSVFNLVRNGKAGDMKTSYTAELVNTDDVTLEQLPPVPQILGSFILPDLSYEEMVEKYINKTAPATPATPAGIVPRTLSANTFAGNTVVTGPQVAPQPAVQPAVQYAVPQTAYQQPVQNSNQAPVQAPEIPF